MKKNFDLSAMARSVGWHDYDIKVLLGIPLDGCCESDNLEEVLAMYLSPLQDELRLVVHKKLDELLLVEFNKATSRDELRAIRKKCPHYSSVRDMIIVKEIDLCHSLSEINAFKSLSSMYSGAGWRLKYLERKMELSESIGDLKSLTEECPSKSDIYYSVIYKWNVVSERTVRQSSDPRKMAEIFNDLCPDSYPFFLEYWLKICEGSADFQTMHRFLFENKGRIIICHDAFMANLRAKWDYASFVESSEAENFTEYLEVLINARDDSKRQAEIFEQCLCSVKSADEAEQLFICSPKVRGLLEKAFNKWLEVSDCQETISLLKFFKEVPGESKEIFYFLDRREVTLAIIRKIAGFYGHK